MSRIKSSSQHTFSVAPRADIPRSSFRRNMNYKTTMNAGYLVPVFVDEVLPGDTFNLKLTSFARILSPLKFPILDNLYLDFHFFFIPTRLVYADYEKFFGSSKGREGNWEYDDSHLMPNIKAPEGGFPIGSIADYFGIPTGVDNIKVNALPFRAYNRIIADWFLPSSYGLDNPECKVDSTDDDWALYPLRKRLKRCDAFTSALPEPQRGPGVTIPLGDIAPVYGNGRTISFTDGSDEPRMLVERSNGGSEAFLSKTAQTDLGEVVSLTQPSNGYKGVGLVQNGDSGLVTDLSSATAIPITSLRQAFQLQRLLERDERSGVQYVSTTLAHFGIRSPDARIQRTEYLGGGSTPIQIHSVANTAGGENRDQASLAAFGLSASSNVGFVKSFTEHGYVFALASIRADVTYQQGIPKMFDRFARFDFYWPVFAHLGEEVIKNKSIYAQGTEEDDEVFGYQERYYDYRYGVSKITGQLRSSFDQSLDSWHLAQSFNNCPRLNSEFLEIDVPMSRVKAVTDAPDFLYDSLIQLNCVRPMPLFGVPGLVDHF